MYDDVICFVTMVALSHMTSEGVCHMTLDSHTSSSTLHDFMNVFMHHNQGRLSYTHTPIPHSIIHPYFIPSYTHTSFHHTLILHSAICPYFIPPYQDLHTVLKITKLSTCSSTTSISLSALKPHPPHTKPHLLHPTR